MHGYKRTGQVAFPPLALRTSPEKRSSAGRPNATTTVLWFQGSRSLQGLQCDITRGLTRCRAIGEEGVPLSVRPGSEMK